MGANGLHGRCERCATRVQACAASHTPRTSAINAACRTIDMARSLFVLTVHYEATTVLFVGREGTPPDTLPGRQPRGAHHVHDIA